MAGQAGLGNIMKFNLNETDKKNIKEAVAKAEEKTHGEIVPMILKESDSYPAAHFRAAIFFGLTLSFALYYFPFYEVTDSIFYLWTVVGGMLLGYCLTLNKRIKRFFLSKKEISEEVHQKAIEAFFYQGVHTTKDRTGILLFISVLEQRAELIADCGINEKVDKDAWDKILNSMLKEFKSGKSADAISRAIAECGELLAKHFPKNSEEHKVDPNELSNEIITE